MKFDVTDIVWGACAIKSPLNGTDGTETIWVTRQLFILQRAKQEPDGLEIYLCWVHGINDNQTTIYFWDDLFEDQPEAITECRIRNNLIDQ